jgi:hypothetical protein
MGVVVETCINYPGGRTRKRGADINRYRYAVLGRAVRTPIYVPGTGPRYAYV